ncbi:hypothetical protein BDF21DRAFT_416273 [Thamnidium elegans]|uniref:C2H2-type domain-containing protein n=1 Tax=Thamnidium elegans TaxID=101142 RepID=A0A8H7SP05_9FUNG|nr:hypothetical protein INT48_003746 [Thamnidium elegans]KAI8083600.1 hypothetical protein BDF21DRAFT_416273 [Thamnidium elegans]
MSMLDITDCVSSPFLKSIAGLQNTELIASPSPYSKLDSYDQKQELEKEFCRDFSCCGLNLGNLHQLLEHYEEYHLTRSGNSSEDEERDQNSSICSFTEDDNSLLQQPMHLAQLASCTSTKAHLTKSDLNMLENAQKYASKQSVQTLDSIVDGLNTPSLSPSESGCHNDQLYDDDVSESSCASWIRKANMIISSSSGCEDQSDKPYRCHIEDCDKAYKNANGLKYHRLHGHCSPSDGSDILDASKPYTCSLGACRKRYKNLNGLKYHIEHTHMTKLQNLSSDMFVKIDAKGRKRRLSSTSSSSSILSFESAYAS